MAERRNPGLEVKNYRRGIIEETIGRVGAFLPNLLLGTPTAIWQKAPDFTEYLKEKYKDVPWEGSVEVHLNRSPLFRQLRRLFQKERRTNLFARVALGLPVTMSAWLTGKFLRANFYNPFTEIAQVYHSNPAIAMHEAGYAEDFDRHKYPSLRAIGKALPFIGNKLSWNASRNAMKHLDPQEQGKAKRVLEPMFGGSLGSILAPFSPLVKWFPFASEIVSIGGLVGGHIHSRVARKNIFYNDPLLPHDTRENKLQLQAVMNKPPKQPITNKKEGRDTRVQSSSQQPEVQSNKEAEQIAERLLDYSTGEVMDHTINLEPYYRDLVSKIYQEMQEHPERFPADRPVYVFSDVARAMIDRIAMESNRRHHEFPLTLQGGYISRDGGNDIHIIALAAPASDFKNPEPTTAQVDSELRERLATQLARATNLNHFFEENGKVEGGNPNVVFHTHYESLSSRYHGQPSGPDLAVGEHSLLQEEASGQRRRFANIGVVTKIGNTLLFNIFNSRRDPRSGEIIHQQHLPIIFQADL